MIEQRRSLPHEAAHAIGRFRSMDDRLCPPGLLDKITSLRRALRQRGMNAADSTLKVVFVQAK